jgi:hypothetical protein
MIFLSGVCGMRADAQNAVSDNGHFFIRPGETGAADVFGTPGHPGSLRVTGITEAGLPDSDPGRRAGHAPGLKLFHFDSDDRFEVAFLGELYNSSPAGINPATRILHELRQTGLETGANPPSDAAGRIPRVLPDDFLNRIDGIFIAIIHDRHRQRAHFISDRLGLRYLYFHRQNGRLWWATETKAFLSCPAFPRSFHAMRSTIFCDMISSGAIRPCSGMSK